MSDEQKAMIALLQSMKSSLDKSAAAQEKLTEEVQSQRKELDEMKRDIPEFLSSASGGRRGSPKRQSDIMGLVDELLLLERDNDRPEYLSEIAVRDQIREDGIDKVGDIFTKLLYRANMNDITLKYPKQWERDDEVDKW